MRAQPTTTFVKTAKKIAEKRNRRIRFGEKNRPTSNILLNRSTRAGQKKDAGETFLRGHSYGSRTNRCPTTSPSGEQSYVTVDLTSRSTKHDSLTNNLCTIKPSAGPVHNVVHNDKPREKRTNCTGGWGVEARTTQNPGTADTKGNKKRKDRDQA